MHSPAHLNPHTITHPPQDTKAAGMQWIFGPVLDMHAQPQWSRCFETFGEDPYVIGQLAKAVIEGTYLAWPALLPDCPTRMHPSPFY